MNPPPENWYQPLTAPGPAAVAVVRLCGPRVAEFAARHLGLTGDVGQAGSVRRVTLREADGATLDDALLSVHAGPPRWDVRLHLHGGPWLGARCRALLEAAGFAPHVEAVSTLWPAAGALLAEAWAALPEYPTERGARWVLAQAARLDEALAALLAGAALDETRCAATALALRATTARAFRTPRRVALVGPPNVGKSTLANALADRPVSLVSPTPGTTRDWVETPGELAGFPVLWLDTAGLRAADDELEAAGVARTSAVLATADAVVLVLDVAGAGAAEAAARAALTAAGREPTLVVWNKVDLTADAAPRRSGAGAPPAAWVSAERMVTAAGVSDDRAVLEAALGAALGLARVAEALPAAFTARQVAWLAAAAGAGEPAAFRVALERCRDGVDWPGG